MLDGTPQREGDIIATLKERYANPNQTPIIQDMAEAEIPWWQKVRTELLNRAKAEDSKWRKAQLSSHAERIQKHILTRILDKV
jgi:hypothetical protein